MADIRCSRCGKNNPDFFDVCQFCQSPLKPESMVHIGEEPTKQNTGALEEILPDWLKDARQQGKNEEAADDAFRPQTRAKVPNEGPPDLLAGLMSQADSDEDEVPDWLAGINPVAEKKSPFPKPPSVDKEEPSDFLAQFRKPESQPSAPAVSEPAQEETPATWMGMNEEPSGQRDGLTDWFSQAPDEPVSFEGVGGAASDDNSWMTNLGSFDTPEQKPLAEKEPEDLGWLHDLEAASKGAGDVPALQKDAGFDVASSSSGEDLSWLNNLGGASAPSLEKPAVSQPSSSEEDLNWLNNLGGTSVPSFEEPAPSQPASSGEDLSWLKDFGGTPAPAFEEPVRTQPPSSDEDLDWLNKLGAASAPVFEESAPSQPSSSGDDLDWLGKLGGTSEPVFEESAPSQPSSSSQEDLDWLGNLAGTAEAAGTTTPAFSQEEKEPQGLGTPASTSSKPFRTAPLNELLSDASIKDAAPDWLKSAMKEPTMPPPGAVSMDWSPEHGKPVNEKLEGSGARPQEEPDSSQPAFDFALGNSSTSSAQDVDALFTEMPDWLSREPESAETPRPETAPASTDDSLAPVELPSWVQAMRPVDSAISGISASNVDQITEREGPLAGLQGVIPSAPIGSSLRPKAFSLKLQITEEQQASASLIEQIVAGETTVQPRKPAGIISSQRVLRWAISGLFLAVLSIVLGLGLQTMPIIPSNQLSDLVSTIPDGLPVLVVVDYEPSFAGELEAAAGPLLDQLALSRRSTFTFISMSPNGSALVDRLMFNAKISRPAPDGLGYQPGLQYFNLGFLPGGPSGVLGFIEDPRDEFSKFEAVILMTDNAETGRVWVEQLDVAKGKYPEIAGKPLIVVSSAQSGPLLQSYVSSGQVDIMVNGLYDAARYEYVNNTRPGTVRSYWDAFGVGLMMAVIAIVLGSVWSVLMRIRERRAEAEQG